MGELTSQTFRKAPANVYSQGRAVCAFPIHNRHGWIWHGGSDGFFKGHHGDEHQRRFHELAEP